MLENIRTIYFDYDGTLHNSIKIYEPAFRKAYDYLVKINKAEPRVWKEEEISKWLGYSSVEMWDSFMKDLDERLKKQASSIIGKEMLNQINLGNAELYTNSLSTLGTLKERGYKLVFLSNCRIDYMNLSRKKFNLDKYFDHMYCAESYNFIPKDEILAHIKGIFPYNQVIVGDRFHDIEAGIRNGIDSIWCEYGFGKDLEAEGSTYRIKDIKEILNYL